MWLCKPNHAQIMNILFSAFCPKIVVYRLDIIMGMMVLLPNVTHYMQNECCHSNICTTQSVVVQLHGIQL